MGWKSLRAGIQVQSLHISFTLSLSHFLSVFLTLALSQERDCTVSLEVTIHLFFPAYTVTWWSTWMLRLFSKPSVMSTWLWTGYAPPSSTSEHWRTPHTMVRSQNPKNRDNELYQNQFPASLSSLFIFQSVQCLLQIQFQVSRLTWTDMESKQNYKVVEEWFWFDDFWNLVLMQVTQPAKVWKFIMLFYFLSCHTIELCLKNLNSLSSLDLIHMDEDINIKPTGTEEIIFIFCLHILTICYTSFHGFWLFFMHVDLNDTSLFYFCHMCNKVSILVACCSLQRLASWWQGSVLPLTPWNSSAKWPAPRTSLTWYVAYLLHTEPFHVVKLDFCRLEILINIKKLYILRYEERELFWWKMSLQIDLVSKSKEFTDIQLRVNEKKTLNILNRDKNRITIRSEAFVQLTSSWTKSLPFLLSFLTRSFLSVFVQVSFGGKDQV